MHMANRVDLLHGDLGEQGEFSQQWWWHARLRRAFIPALYCNYMLSESLQVDLLDVHTLSHHMHAQAG